MKNWKVKERDGLDILLYRAKDGKTKYSVEYMGTHRSSDDWEIVISRDSQSEGFHITMTMRIKHGPDYDNRVLQMAEDRIKKLLNEVKP